MEFFISAKHFTDTYYEIITHVCSVPVSLSTATTDLIDDPQPVKKELPPQYCGACDQLMVKQYTRIKYKEASAPHCSLRSSIPVEERQGQHQGTFYGVACMAKYFDLRLYEIVIPVPVHLEVPPYQYWEAPFQLQKEFLGKATSLI
jgi:hypothetical protein